MLHLKNLPSSIAQRSVQTAFKYLILTSLLIGIFFRFVNLDHKVYWGDETWTSIFITGNSPKEFESQIANGNVLSLADMQAYQQLNPTKTTFDVIQNIVREDPQHPPLYYVGARLWALMFGDSITSVRAFSALISLLIFPLIYSLSRELFNSSLTGWFSVVLVAVSPLQVLYAQEAREYSLVAVTTLLSSYMLLQAIRLKTLLSWTLYTISLILGLYTSFFFIPVAVGHGIYTIIFANFRLTKIVKLYLLSFGLGVLLFCPWLLTLQAVKRVDWVGADVALVDLLKTWLLNLTRCFIDFNYSFIQRDYLMYGAIIISTALVFYSIYFVYRKNSLKTWLFVTILTGFPALLVVAPDLILGGRRSSVTRYLIPCYLGIQIAVSFFLSNKIFLPISKNLQRKYWQVFTFLLISFSILSCLVSSGSLAWWNKYNSFHIPNIAQIINQSQKPLVIWYGVPPLDLSHCLKSEVYFQAGIRQKMERLKPENRGKILVQPIPNEFSDVFVLSHNHTTEILEAVLEQLNYQVDETYLWKRKIEPVYETKAMLWKLKKQGV